MKKIIIANWKMNPTTPRAALRLMGKVARGLRGIKNVEVILAPPFVFLPILRHTPYAIRHMFKLGAQDVFYEREGAFTGEVAPPQLKASGARMVVIGHSERRAMGETDDAVNKKIKAVLESGMRAVLCVGEKERKASEVFPKVVREELLGGIRKIKKSLLANFIIAYEPVWAISSNARGKADTPKNVYEMAILIRRELYRALGKRAASKIPVLYGGSVDEKNAAEFVAKGAIDGLLVGGASLNAKKFVSLVKAVDKIK
ncbi:triose-phosphate isomerase [Candidatus Giovannonibacteria bacterium RIFCSPHIGHO2_01_FULL_45_24]|uniref:Triosephosphate isomerase n=1 Tax=Candidatus Giovannonibacteria bacterium RIFCSPLOWO2_01_FULL_46_32 TaxID=1798353 RepID=A0A1F5XIB3_9BACT|nr:MAG: triose-phosphate isomerase [Candidatus Giovannonibacteria bacterium RIFCSPHIGHO2_01_FULL_45_24]OGF87682.1 MAG: triose-phosphate isomerase [Candidatus Giovannonibacteria bacterium RIFCSPLOWO2_01_FULL_46_32]